MGISEFTVHNVLRTYSRQEQLGRVHRSKVRTSASMRTADQISLSPAGRKVQLLGQFAGELVDERQPGLPEDERTAQVRSTQGELLGRHEGDVGDEKVTPETFEARLRALYLG